MLVAELEYWLNNSVNPQCVPSRRLAHVKKLSIGRELKDVVFSVVTDDGTHSAACDLINNRYNWRGYGSAHSIPANRNHTTFVAEVDDDVIGTITLAVDSEEGLAIDRTFAEEAEQIRAESGVRMCELTKLAFDGQVRSKEVMAGLFHLAFIYGTSASDCTDLFIEVNPRHARFYEMMLGFCEVGLSKLNASVGAPAQLMRLKVDNIRRNICKMAGKASAAVAHSLYPYFFSLDDESQIRQSLALPHPPKAKRIEHVMVPADSCAILGELPMSNEERAARRVRRAA